MSAVWRSAEIIRDTKRLEHLRKRKVENARRPLDCLCAEEVRYRIQYCDSKEVAPILRLTIRCPPCVILDDVLLGSTSVWMQIRVIQVECI